MPNSRHMLATVEHLARRCDIDCRSLCTACQAAARYSQQDGG
jgi:hypothetical protein